MLISDYPYYPINIHNMVDGGCISLSRQDNALAPSGSRWGFLGFSVEKWLKAQRCWTFAESLKKTSKYGRSFVFLCFFFLNYRKSWHFQTRPEEALPVVEPQVPETSEQAGDGDQEWRLNGKSFVEYYGTVDLIRINLWILVCWLIILDYSHPPTFEELGVSPSEMVVPQSWRWRLI